MTRKATLLAEISLALIVALGIFVVWGCAFGFTWSTAKSYLVSSVSESIYVLEDGQPVIVVSRNSGPAAYRQEFRDLEGKRMPGLGYSRVIDRINLYNDQRFGLPSTWNQRIVELNDPVDRSLTWFLIHDGQIDGRAYFVAYHLDTKLPVEYIGNKGFRKTMPPAAEMFRMRNLGQFAQPSQYEREEPKKFDDARWYLASGGRLYRIDLRRHSVSPVKLDLDEPVLYVSASSGNKDPRLVVETRGHIVFLEHTEKGYSVPIPAALKGDAIQVYRLPERRLLAVGMDFSSKAGRRKVELVWIDSSGKATKTRTLRLQSGQPQDDTAILLPLLLPAPLPFDFTVAMLPLASSRDEGTTYAERLRAALGENWPGLVVVNLAGVALALACGRREARYCQSRTSRVIWPAFVFLLGVPGYVAYRTHRRWPIQEPCPNCGILAPRDRLRCDACGEDFPLPMATGTEIFA